MQLPHIVNCRQIFTKTSK